MMRAAVVVVVVAVAVAVGCGGGGGGIDARQVPDAPADAPVIDARVIDATPPDAGLPVIGEAPDCGGDALVARGGDVALAVSALSIPALAESFDLDGDGDQDNKMAAISSLAQSQIDDGLAMGTYVLPIEIFDRDADPDACVKLALYAGTCASPPCDMTDGVADTVALDPSSYAGDGTPYSRLRAMATDGAGALVAGPGPLLVPIPITDGTLLPLPITVQVVEGTLGIASLTGFKLGGTMQSFRLDHVAMPPIDQIGVMPGDSLLDGIFANLLGPLLAMPQSPFMSGCRTADIDLDNDGLESFCDSNPNDDLKRVDTCIDGDGTVVTDGPDGEPRCTDTLVGGAPQFPDGISAAILLDASPSVIAP